MCVCWGTTSAVCAVRFTKSFLFKYAVITKKKQIGIVGYACVLAVWTLSALSLSHY